MKKSKKLLSMMLALALTATMATGIGAITANAEEVTEDTTPPPVACVTCETDGVVDNDDAVYENGFCTKDSTHYQAATPNDKGTAEDDTDDYYEIGNAGQLYWFAEQINSKSTTLATQNAKLTANVVINENVLVDGELNSEDFREWEPIGYYKSSTDLVDYSGTFNGNGMSISGLYAIQNINCSASSDNYVGLFGRAGNATIENLGVKDSYFFANNIYVGSLVGYQPTGTLTITGCYNEGKVTAGKSDAGGLVGTMATNTTLTITDSYNSGDVTAKDSAAGGLVGYTFSSTPLTITDSYNSGDVTATSDNAGGLVGLKSSGTLTITDSYNSGDVTAEDGSAGGLVGSNSSGTSTITDSYNSGDVTADSYAGGLVGYRSYGTLTITGSYNSGDVTATSDNAGGLVGRQLVSTPLTITDSYNSGDVTADNNAGGLVGNQYVSSTLTITDSYNSGDVTATTSNAGGLVGFVSTDATTIENTFYLSETLADDGLEGTTPATSAEFASGAVAYLMNKNDGVDEDVWFQTVGTDASPSLNSEKGAVTLKTIAFNEVDDQIINEMIAELKAALEAKDEELAQADADNKEALENIIADAKAALEAKDAEIADINASQQTFIIIVCVIAGLAFAGCGTLGVFYFLDKKKKA